MIRLRKLLVCLFAGLAIAGPMAQVSRVDAHPNHGHTHQRNFYIYYRACCHSQWYYYGYTTCSVEAQRYANWIRSLGYEVFVR
jgi:hypothetical protein